MKRGTRDRKRCSDATSVKCFDPKEKTGSVAIHFAGKRAADEVVSAEPGDLTLLGSRTLEDFNLRVDPVAKRLVGAAAVPQISQIGIGKDLSVSAKICGLSAT